MLQAAGQRRDSKTCGPLAQDCSAVVSWPAPGTDRPPGDPAFLVDPGDRLGSEVAPTGRVGGLRGTECGRLSASVTCSFPKVSDGQSLLPLRQNLDAWETSAGASSAGLPLPPGDHQDPGDEAHEEGEPDETDQRPEADACTVQLSDEDHGGQYADGAPGPCVSTQFRLATASPFKPPGGSGRGSPRRREARMAGGS